jgi:Tol biopolymer transport system component
MDLARTLSTRITFNQGWNPAWSPDGKFLYYSNRTGVFRKPADGSGEEVLLAKQDQLVSAFAVSRDATSLLFGFDDILNLPLAQNVTSPAIEPYLKTDRIEAAAAFSPDGRWVAYMSDESGRFEIYVQGYPERRGKWLISAAGGGYPVWRRDGKELYWTSPDGTVTAAAVELLPDNVRASRPQPLFRLLDIDRRYGGSVDTLDGLRFLTFEPEAGAMERRPMVVVLNWAARLPEAR